MLRYSQNYNQELSPYNNCEDVYFAFDIKHKQFVVYSDTNKYYSLIYDTDKEYISSEGMKFDTNYLFSNIVYLTIQRKFLKYLKCDSFPNLKSLTIEDGGSDSWPQKLILNNLRMLRILQSKNVFIHNPLNTPNIDWLTIDCTNDTDGRSLLPFQPLLNAKRIKYLQLYSIKKWSPFDLLKEAGITGISIVWCSIPENHFVSLFELLQLKYLDINNLGIVFDCEKLLKLQSLEEFSIINTKHVKNIECLAIHPTLKVLTIADCGKSLQDIDRTLFSKEKFEYLKLL